MHVHRTCIEWHMVTESYADMNTHRDKHLDARRHMEVQHVRQTVLLTSSFSLPPGSHKVLYFSFGATVPRHTPLARHTPPPGRAETQVPAGQTRGHETAYSIVSTHSRAKWFTSQVYTAWVTRSWERPLSWVLGPHP